MEPNMHTVVVSNVVLVVHSDRDGDDREWDQCIELMATRRSELLGVLVFTPGPGPASDKRARIAKLNEDLPVPIAVCSSSRLARGIVTALSWFGVPIKAFDANRTDLAMAFLKIPEASRASIRSEFESLKIWLNPPETVRIAPGGRSNW
jgi:hypothetical protein